MADISVTAANVAFVSGSKRTLNAAETITAGQTLYETSSGTWAKGDNNDTAAKAVVGGIALNGASSGQPVTAALPGSVINMGATLTVGGVYVQSATAGGVAPVADIVSTNYVTILGVALTAANLSFNPVVSATQAA
jgi:hypothetical protein